MDLRALLRRTAMNRPAVLALALPGATELRPAVEAELRRRQWPVVDAPAAADLLVVCGVPAAEGADWLDDIERSMPAPAVRVVVGVGEGEARQIALALDAARRELIERAVAPQPAEHAEHMEHMEHQEHVEPMEHVHHMDHQGHDHDSHMDHMDHGTHAMGDIAGLPMAERADDRDGLRLDRLHVPFGPGLSDWPAGLILRFALQGDVVQGVEVDHLPVPAVQRPPFWDEPWLRAAHGEEVTRGDAARRRCAAHLDSAGRLLAVAGWDDVAARCRRLRDELLAGATRTEVVGELRRTVRRVGRSRILRWSIAGLGRLPADRARAAGVTGPALAADGDAYDRLLMWLREIERGLEDLDDVRPLAPDDRSGPRGRLDGPRSPSQALLDVLPALLTGAEFAGARIIVASLDPDLDELALAPATGSAHA